jgi:hypothetical protein
MNKILEDIEKVFTDEDGAEYYQYVSFYDVDPFTEEDEVSLDGSFTTRQLKLIVDAMELAITGKKNAT